MVELIVYVASVICLSGMIYWIWLDEKLDVTVGDMTKILITVLCPIINTVIVVGATLFFIIYNLLDADFWNKVVIKGDK